MSQRATSSRWATIRVWLGLLAGSTFAAFAQAPAQPLASLDWRPLGKPAFDAHLASAAGGPIDSVWFSPEGGRVFAHSTSGLTFETADSEHWSPSQTVRSGTPNIVQVRTSPEVGARIVSLEGDAGRAWAMGQNLLVSEDSGGTWTNLTGAHGESIIGSAIRDVAVNPRDSQDIVAANDQGVWRSHDGGVTWSGLNEKLPNLPVARIVSVERGAWRIALLDGRTYELNDARSFWQRAAVDANLLTEASDRVAAQRSLSSDITASARNGDRLLAGSSDGRLWVSRDKGMTWAATQLAGHSAVLRLAVNSENSRAAIAVLAGPGPRVFRSVNSGETWDDITANLPEGPVRAAATDRASNRAFLATDRGIFTAKVDLNAFAPVMEWTSISASLPQAPVVDLALDATTGQLFAALRGFGLYTAVLPSSGLIRLLNAADFSTRPAAPGSVVSVSGARLTRAHVDNLNFPVLAAGENASQIQVPFETPAAALSLSLEAASGRVTLPLAVRSVSPAVFIDRDGAPFLVDADSGLVLDPALGAHPRMRLQIMATGLGRVRPDWPTGVPAPSTDIPKVVANMRVYLDGLPLEVEQATLASGYVGYYVVDFELPAILNTGTADLYVTADGQPSNHVALLLNAQ